jgi:glutathione S-transferase
LYGSNISYFTGKMENYFRVKGIAYCLEPMLFPKSVKTNIARVGVSQMPVVQLPDGRWMTDTTAMIQWFEAHFPEPAILPPDPLQRLVCLLLEDYADEWLWRPAMHYRWYYPEGAHLQSRHLADELLRGLPLPGALKRWQLRHRQRSGYTRGDGIGAATVPGVEAIYLRTLDQLQAIFAQRDFLLGDRPSLADIGFSGPFFRHFALDPVPLEILRNRAPAVLAWVARLWNSHPGNLRGAWQTGIPDDLGPLLDEVGRAYLPYLCANVEAVQAGQRRFDAEIDGVPYRRARYSRYRVWCLAQLRRHVNALPDDARPEAETLLQRHGCWEPLFRQPDLPLLPGQEQGLPFRADAKMVAAND